MATTLKHYTFDELELPTSWPPEELRTLAKLVGKHHEVNGRAHINRKGQIVVSPDYGVSRDTCSRVIQETVDLHSRFLSEQGVSYD